MISLLQHSEWAAPIIMVPNANGKIRVCGNYEVTVNQAVEIPAHLLPNAKDLFANLTGGENFTKFDLPHAFQQVELEDESKTYLTINTHLGLFHFNKLPFGRSSCKPFILLSFLDQILCGMTNVVCKAGGLLIKAETGFITA